MTFFNKNFENAIRVKFKQKKKKKKVVVAPFWHGDGQTTGHPI
jgi:hypothetical protein